MVCSLPNYGNVLISKKRLFAAAIFSIFELYQFFSVAQAI
tara:strand:+ start:1046 stop:1165 length:120 start_codon:yes stop_codon:yes gene_type:complete